MPAFNFKGQFVERIHDGSKGGTIRKYGKRSPVIAGQTLYLYTGQRTKYCKKLKQTPCVEVWHIILRSTRVRLKLDGHKGVLVILSDIELLNQFARSDGFADWETMKRYWRMNDGLPFEGFHARWIPLRDQVNI